eukprot:COSAG01_NODE_45189_length_411_cov_3.660256_1_plen_132_part_01
MRRKKFRPKGSATRDSPLYPLIALYNVENYCGLWLCCAVRRGGGEGSRPAPFEGNTADLKIELSGRDHSARMRHSMCTAGLLLHTPKISGWRAVAGARACGLSRRDPQSLLLIDRAAFFLKTENTIGTRHQ